MSLAQADRRTVAIGVIGPMADKARHSIFPPVPTGAGAGLVTYSPATVIVAEGARVAFISCDVCGASILLDERDGTDRIAAHTEWHQGL